MVLGIDYSTFVRRVLHTIFPVACGSCGVLLHDDPIPFFCRACWNAVTPLRGPSCPSCGQPFKSPVALQHSPQHRCGRCRRRPPYFARAWSLYSYVPPLQDAIRLFKYQKKVALADALADLLHHALPDMPAIDAVVPVPLHASRLREREYNQSLLLADRLCRRRGLALSFDNLARTRATPPQTELTRAQRMINLRGAFTVLRPQEFTQQRLLLMDDVFTTGATVNECAKVLRKAGASDVYVLTLARTG